jgi:diguanylate cyclase (GGDEF)-like protein/PAS domain S-box-containing protein
MEWKRVDEIYSKLNSEKLEKFQALQILSRLIWVTWASYLVVLATGFYWNDQLLIVSSVICTILLIIPFWLLKRGHIIASGYFLVFNVLGMVTTAATIGQGIHDIAILAYPIVIIFASLALDRYGFKISVLLTLVSMGWLVFGETSGLFVSQPLETPTWIDFLIISVILLVVALAVNLLSRNVVTNLEMAKLEIVQRKIAENELREKEVQFHNIADSGLALIWTSGTDKLCNYFNKPWMEFTGRTLEQELGNGWAEGVHPDDLDRCISKYVSAFDKHIPFEMEYRLKHVSGEYRWIRDMGTPNYNSSQEFTGYIGHCFDITEHKRAEDQLRYQGTHDILTGIYNRLFFEEELSRIEHGRNFPVSIMIADVDELKLVNDTLGHSMGDQLLKQTANILKSVFRSDEVLARIGGDEFAALLPSTSSATAEQIVMRIKDQLEKYNLQSHDLPISISVGMATADSGILTGTFTQADQLMYAEKSARKLKTSAHPKLERKPEAFN